MVCSVQATASHFWELTMTSDRFAWSMIRRASQEAASFRTGDCADSKVLGTV